MFQDYPKRSLSKKYSLSFHKKDLEFMPCFTDFMAKAIFGEEEHKDFLSFLLSEILRFPVHSKDLSFYKNEIAPNKISSLAFRTDIPVFFKDTLILLEFNSSFDEIYSIRNKIYQGLIYYQFLRNKGKQEVFLININNFYNTTHEVLIEEYVYRNKKDQKITENLKTLEVYLPIAVKKFYNDGIKKAKLSRLEKLILACYMGTKDKAKEMVKGDDMLMSIIDELLELSKQMKYEYYPHSFEEVATDSRNEGISIGEKQEKEKTAKKLLNLNVSHDIIMKATGLSETELLNL